MSRRILLAGATGALGVAIVERIQSRERFSATLELAASAESAAKRIEVGGRYLRVAELGRVAFASYDLVVLATPPDLSLNLPHGARVLDLRVATSGPSQRRLCAELPGAVGNAASAPSHLVIPTLRQLDQQFGLRSVSLASYESAVARGIGAVSELGRQAASLLNARPVEDSFQFAFNVRFDPDGGVDWHQELAQLLNLDLSAITTHRAQVGMMYGTAIAMRVRTKTPMERAIGEDDEPANPFACVGEPIPRLWSRIDELDAKQMDLWLCGDATCVMAEAAVSRLEQLLNDDC